MAFPRLRRDPEWTKRPQEMGDEIGLKDAVHAAMVRKAEGVAAALREAIEGPAAVAAFDEWHRHAYHPP